MHKHNRPRTFLAMAGAVGALLLLSAGCSMDAAVDGGDGLSGDGQAGGDLSLTDAWAGKDGTWSDGVWSEGISPDGATLDAAGDPGSADTQPLGCKSDADCPASACSKPSCDPASHQCVPFNAPDGFGCTAGSGLCASAGFCQAGVCQAAKPHCDDGNPCTSESCDPATGSCAGTPIPGCGGCNGDASCDDGVKCTQDVCKGGVCAHFEIPGCGMPQPCQNDAQCEDGDLCTFNACAAGICLTSGVTCPAGEPCTVGTCDPKTGQCVLTKVPGCGGLCQVDNQCNDGNLCTADVCKGGQCVSFPNVGCASPDPCVLASCNPKTGQCDLAKNPDCGGMCKTDAQCSDGNLCTQEYCKGGMCISGPSVGCASPDPCLAASCNPKTGQCMFTPIPGCGGTGCMSDAACNDGLVCTQDLCVFGANGMGMCMHQPNLAISSKQCCDPNSQMMFCNDGNPCTQDVCGPNFECAYLPVPGCGGPGCKADFQCDDGLICTVDTCAFSSSGAGKCAHTVDWNMKGFCCDPMMNSITCYDGDNCTTDYCGGNYQCSYQPIPGCGSTGCKSDKECFTGDPCTTGKCDFATGMCMYATNPNCNPPCDPAMCNDGNDCTKDVCDASGSCMYYLIPGCTPGGCTDTGCNDFDACTSDLCLNGSCMHKAVSCDDGNPCTQDQCVATSGACNNAAIPGCKAVACKDASLCDDGNPCTADSCQFGWCQHVQSPGCLPPP